MVSAAIVVDFLCIGWKRLQVRGVVRARYSLLPNLDFLRRRKFLLPSISQLYTPQLVRCFEQLADPLTNKGPARMVDTGVRVRWFLEQD